LKYDTNTFGRMNSHRHCEKDLAFFEGHKIRRLYDEKTETWWFSVVDVIQVLTQQPDYQTARKYWKVLKSRLAKEGSEPVTNCYQLKMAADDGKQRLTDVAKAEIRSNRSVIAPTPTWQNSKTY
jgi:DNA-damage-inducible protein D